MLKCVNGLNIFDGSTFTLVVVPSPHRTHPPLLSVRRQRFCRRVMVAPRWQERHRRVDKSCRGVVTRRQKRRLPRHHDASTKRPVRARRKPSFRGEKIAASRSRSTIIDGDDDGYENYSDSKPGHVTIFGFIAAIVTVALAYTYYRRGATETKRAHATYAEVEYGVYPDHPAPVRRVGEAVIRTSTGISKSRDSGDHYRPGGSGEQPPDNVGDLGRSVQKRAWPEI